MKPADSQFLVSTARFQPWSALNGVTAIVIFVVGFRRLGRAPALVDVAAALAMLVVAAALLYSLWIITVSAVFYVVRIDNLTYLFTSIFDAARWPVTVFRGLLRLFFTFVIPLALMTTYPAQALLGALSPGTLALSIAGALVFTVIGRAVWMRSIGRYTSASS
jgi:ABC-2 type transport system permease protein